MWGCQLSSIWCLPRWRIRECSLDIEGTGEIKYLRRTWKLTYDGLPRGNQDRGWSGNCKWEAALAKLIIGGDECNWFSYRLETDRRRWEPSCRLSHCDVEGKQKPPHYDLKATTKVLWWIHLVLNFQEIKQSPQSDLRDGTAPDRIIKKEVNKKYFNIMSLLKIWQQSLSIIAKWMHCKGRVTLVISYNFTYRCDSV
jgi:hypothetical protein